MLPNLAHALHILFATLWLGGMAFAIRALAFGDNPAAAAANERIRRLVSLNLLLGVRTVAVAAWGQMAWGRLS